MHATSARRPLQLTSVQLVPLTPFTPDGRQIMSDVLAEFIESMVQAGMRTLIPAAGTGEFHSLSSEEILQCVRIARETAGTRAQVVAPVGFTLEQSVHLGRRAADLGADALLLMPPIHPYLCDDGFRDYLSALARDVSLPLLCYKKGPVPSDKLLVELGNAGHLAGVKYAVNDLDAFTRFAERRGNDLLLYCGTAERFAPFFTLAGAKGYTTGAGNLCARLTLALGEALDRADFAEAMRLLRILRPIEDFRAEEGDSFNISLLKFGLSLRGWEFGPPRPPQRQLSARDRERIAAALQPVLEAEKQLEATSALAR